MSHVLFAWEHGMGLGHLQSMRPLAAALAERGHRVTFGLRDLSRAHTVLGEAAAVVQVPVWNPPPVPRGGAPVAGYAELLARIGYLDATAMAGFARGWRQLFELLHPDLLVCEYAPTALLASHGLGMARATMGTGFTCPPPQPWLRFDSAAPSVPVEPLEMRLVGALNQALSMLGAPALEHLGELLAVDEQFVCTFPELDPYRSRRHGDAYWGPRGVSSEGARPAAPVGVGKRVFAYLKPGSNGFEPMMDALAASQAQVLAFTPGVTAAARARYEASGLILSPQPVTIAEALAECDLLVCHGGHGTTCAALLAGVPVLVVPAQLEQSLTAARVCKAGAGAVWLPGMGQEPLHAVRSLLDESGFKEAARQFAAAHRNFDETAASMGMVERLEALIAGAPSAPCRPGVT